MAMILKTIYELQEMQLYMAHTFSSYFCLVTSTPHFSQITPRCFNLLYFPQRHSKSFIGPKIFAQNKPSLSGLKVL